MCGSCGRLRWPDRGLGAPHRREAAGPEPERLPCTHCDETLWLDLGRPSTALALRSVEHDRAQARGSFPLTFMATVLMGVPFGWFLALIVGAGAWPQLLAGGLGGLLGGLIALRGHRSVGADEASALPARWAMALPPTAAPQQHARGEAVATGEPLRAPLSGRPCLAWEVGARPDDRADAPAQTWWLIEQRLCALEVDGVALDPERTYLERPRARLGTLGSLELDDSAQAFLRQRGISAEAGEVHLFETIVEPGAEVEVSVGPDGARLGSDS